MKTLQRLAGICALLVLPLLAGCSDEREAEQADAAAVAVEVAETPLAKGIAWYPGSVEEAFASAASLEKPIFLYWGAEWCPPCHELKSTIFRRDEFIAQSRLFVPVYLDGDTERAQQYGEQFGVYGYPTVIIFDPEGAEITRIPGGMDIQRYVSVLEQALNALQPVSELLLAVEKGQEIRDGDWTLLANYSWGQDRGRALGERELGQVLDQLARACPERLKLEHSQLQMLAIGEWASGEEPDPKLAEPYLARAQQILEDATLARANLTVAIYGGADLIGAFAANTAPAELLQLILLPLTAAIEDPEVDVLRRIDALFGWVDANKAVLAEGETLTQEQQTWVSTRVEAAKGELDSYQQHVGLSTIAELYFELGLEKEARAVADEGMALSKQPYYFMSIMAYFERKSGNDQEAIDWYRRAWEASQGPATRVQWGTNYLYALLELAADDLDTIGATANIVFSELEAQRDGLHQRNSARLDRLSKRMLAWAKPAETDAVAENLRLRQGVLDGLRSKMDQLCETLEVTTETAKTCQTFLVFQEPPEEPVPS